MKIFMKKLFLLLLIFLPCLTISACPDNESGSDGGSTEDPIYQDTPPDQKKIVCRPMHI